MITLRGHGSAPYECMCKAPVKRGRLIPFYKMEVRLGKFTATDLKSVNGLIVNGKPVRRASLNDGDIIQLGEAILRIDCG